MTDNSNSNNIIGLVLVTHGNLAQEFISAMQHVVGKQDKIEAVCIGPEDDMEMRRSEILKKVEETDSGQGVVVLTDMFGGTPSNLAISIMDKAKVEIIAGINLPMLIRFLTLSIFSSSNSSISVSSYLGKSAVCTEYSLVK